ncbi:hypothetical protein ACA910_022759 [Epithemia clementina (nom. ined.)]
MDDEVAVSLAEALQNNPSWKKLDLRRSKIGIIGWQALSSALRSNTVWETLNLSNTEIDDEAATVLFAALQPNKTWKELNLSGLRINMSGAKALVGAWTENTSWLKLNYCTKMKDNGAIALASAMQHNTSWKVLDFHGSTFGFDGAAVLAAALEGHERWQYVIIKITLIKENEIKRIAQYLQQSKDWERFVLHCMFSDFNRAKVVEAIISRPKARAWKSLVLWFSFMSSDANENEALAQQLIIFFHKPMQAVQMY